MSSFHFALSAFSPYNIDAGNRMVPRATLRLKLWHVVDSELWAVVWG